ncbi:MAG TPA: ABC transporter permease [Phototrophicaceae bacterium]|nr:ABC transporter permease [Phototrophicaceae bacterium]
MAAESHPFPVTVNRAERQKQIVLAVSRLWGWVFLVGLIIFFATRISATTDGDVNFLTLRNSQNILMAITPVLLMGLGQTFVIITGGIDLSVGWVMGLASVVSALVIADFVNRGMAEGLAIILGFVIGVISAAIPGFINGMIIAKLKIPSFIVTLGMSFVARGISMLLSGGNVVIGQPPGVRTFGNEALLYLISGEDGGLYFLQKPNVTGELLQRLDRILPWPVVVTALATLILLFVLHRMQFGRHTYAIGGNREAALRAGIKVDRHMIMLYTLSGITVGIAGILHTARFNGGSSVGGDPQMMPSIAAVIIGGVSMSGGHGSVAGTVIGALIVAVLTTGLVMLNVQPFWQYIIIGIVIILAVLIDQTRDLIVGRMEARGQ